MSIAGEVKNQLTLALLVLLQLPALGSFSRFVILTPQSKNERHRDIHPELIVNKDNEDIVNIRIRNNGFTDMRYWLVIANEKLPDSKLNFRKFRKDLTAPNFIHTMTLTSARGWWADRWRQESDDYYSVILHKSLLKRAYLYHDHASPLILDGGYFYTIKLSEYPVQPNPAREDKNTQEEDPIERNSYLKKDIEEYLENWSEALNRNDVTLFSDYYHKDNATTVITSTGRLYKSYDDFAQGFKEDLEKVEFSKSIIEDIRVRQFGPATLVSFVHKFRYRSRENNSLWQVHVRTTTTLSHLNSRWQIVMEHSSPIEGIERLTRIDE